MMRPSEISTLRDLRLEKFWRAQKSRPVRDMLNTAAYFALSDLGIRIVGEKGSGKLHLARLIHEYSSRGKFSFTHIDCSELPSGDPESVLFGMDDRDGMGNGNRAGLLESADVGTIYIDMIPSLPSAAQAKLNKAVEQRHFRRIGGSRDVHLTARVITGHTQRHGVEQDDWTVDSNFRARVGPVCINIPPLRERKDDIEPLIYLFLKEYSGENGKIVTHITSEALDICRYYSWPGNIYELRNVIRHSAIRCDLQVLDTTHLPEYVRQENTAGEVHRLAGVPTRVR